MTAVGAAVCVAVGLPSAQQPSDPAAADRVVVTAQVVDRTGQPVPGLAAEAFEAALNGRRRGVASARFVVPATSDAPGDGGRAFVLAIDTASFNASESIGVVIAAQGFVDNVPPSERVGLVTYPEGPRVEPTVERDSIRQALESVVGRDDVVGGDPFTRSLDALDALLPDLENVPGRTIVVVITPGLGASDRADSPTPPAEQLAEVSVAAAAAGGAVYTLFVDRGFIQMMLPHKFEPGAPFVPPGRPEDDVVLQWLAQVSARTGGALVKVSGVNPEPAFARVLSETAAYYELAIEPSDTDWDGQPHALGLRVASQDTVVRAPSWVVVPERLRPDPGPGSASASSSTADRTNGAAALDPLLRAYEREDYALVYERLGGVLDLPRLLRSLRAVSRPWPEAPRRSAVFALVVAAAAVASNGQSTVDETVRLLMQQSDMLGSSSESDGFQCGWHWAALALLQGSVRTAETEPAGARALERCPREARIVLADAVLTDQRYPVIGPAIRSGEAARAEAAAHQAIIDRYEAARAFPETELEARVRLAWLLFRLRRFDEALALTGNLDAPPSDLAGNGFQADIDRQVRYVGYFVRGQTLRERRDFDRALEAYRQAVEIWPEAQSARVALMTLLATRGGRGEAEQLAAAIAAAPDDASDPWRWFAQGDLQLFPLLLQRLRELQ